MPDRVDVVVDTVQAANGQAPLDLRVGEPQFVQLLPGYHPELPTGDFGQFALTVMTIRTTTVHIVITVGHPAHSDRRTPERQRM